MAGRRAGCGTIVGFNAGEINANPPPGGGMGDIMAAVPGVLGASEMAMVPLDCLLVLVLLEPVTWVDPLVPDFGELFLGISRALAVAVVVAAVMVTIAAVVAILATEGLGEDVGVDSDPERFMREAGVTGSKEDLEEELGLGVGTLVGIAVIALDAMEMDPP